MKKLVVLSGFLTSTLSWGAEAAKWQCQNFDEKIHVQVNESTQDEDSAVLVVSAIDKKEGNKTRFSVKDAAVYRSEKQNEVSYHAALSDSVKDKFGDKDVAGTKVKYLKYARVQISEESEALGGAGVWEDGTPFADEDYYLGTLQLRKSPLKSDKTDKKVVGKMISISLTCFKK